MKRKKGKDKLSKKINRFKLKAGVILLSVSLTVFSIVLIGTMISNLISSAAAIIFSSTNQITFLYCDGTYSNNNVNVHIWSDESGSSVTTANGGNLNDMLAFAKKYANDNSYKYRKWKQSNKYTHQCPLCHPESNQYATKGWNCRGFVAACLYHGLGIKNVKCACDGLGMINGKVSDFSLKNWEKNNGKGWVRIYNNGKKLKTSQLQNGDIVFYFNDGANHNEMSHVALVYDISNKKVTDATSGGGVSIRKAKTFGLVGFRYVGTSQNTNSGSIQDKAVAWAAERTKEHCYRYVNWSSGDKKTHKSCPYCYGTKKGTKYYGWQCIGFVSAAYHHAGLTSIPCTNSGFGGDPFFTSITQSSLTKKHGKNWKLITNDGSKGGSHIPKSKLQKGDVLLGYDKSGTFKHLMLYAGNGKYYDIHTAMGKGGNGGKAKTYPTSSGRRITRAIRYIGSTPSAPSNNSIDFTVESSKIIGKRFELIKSNLSDGVSTGALNASLIIDEKNNKFEISGTLCGNTIILNGNAADGKLNGDGYYGSITGEFNGNITLSGAELKASTPIQLKIAQTASGYVNPYNNGWHGLCEAWVGDVYRRCGLYYAGSCCASRSKIKNASNSSGKSIPVGAAIYSGSNYRSNITCECGLNAGHVAIYIGNNKVAGSQSQYIMSLQAWTNYFGYGGWYLPNN